jgi:PAS domain S-box-containing protein
MKMQLEDPAREVKRLRRCINDLISVLALPATWIGSEPSRIVNNLLDGLLKMLDLDLVYVRLGCSTGEALELLRASSTWQVMPQLQEVGEMVRSWLGDGTQNWPELTRKTFKHRDISILPLQLGLQGEIGVLVAGSERIDFPQLTERLVVSVAANQATIGLKEAWLLKEQKRTAGQLEREVAERTEGLAAANQKLKKSEAALHKALDEIKKSEAKLRQVIDAIPTLAWCNLPDGPNEFLNRGWHEYTGLSPEESSGWGWQVAFHPQDLPPLMEKWRKMLDSGESDEIEARLRRHDGVYRWFLIRAQAFRDDSGKIVRWYGTSTDIEDRKRAEEAQRASERNLAAIINTTPTTAWTTRPDGYCDFLNQVWLDYAGMATEQAQGWGWAQTIHRDDRNKLVEEWRSCLASGTRLDTEARIRRFDNTYRWFLIRANPLRDESGNILKWYGTGTDIEDRKRGEEALHDREQSLRLILDGIAGLVAIMSASGEVEAVNRQVLNYFGRSLEQVKAWSTSGAVHPEDLPAVISAWRHSVEVASPYDVDHRLRRADGVYRWFHARGLPLRDLEGRVLRWYVLLTDIDDRRRAEEALQASERELGLIVNTIPALAWSARPDGSAEFFSQHYLAYVALPLEQLQGSGWTVAIHPDDLGRWNDYWQSTIAAGEPREIEVRLRRLDGTYRWFLFRASPLRDGSGAIVKWYGTNTDIDDRKRAEEELRNAQSELARVMRVMTMGQLTASIAHEVNQPLSGIMTNASTCLRMLDANPPNLDGARETARRTIRDSHRASDVIGRLRTLYSKKEPALESTDLNETAREVTALSSTEIQRNGVTLRQEFAEDLPPALGDRIQLQQVILNLLRNAVDAMSTIDDRPKELLVRTERDDGNQVRLSVKDSGVGFTPQAADKIFEAFYTTKTDGMGIGLSISRSIIEAHQGRLWATRNDGPGSTFSFSIPCTPEGWADAEIRMHRADPSTDAA